MALPLLASAQTSRTEYQAKKEALEKEIRQTSQLLKKTEENKNNVYARYELLKKQGSQRESLIRMMQEEISLLDSASLRGNDVMDALGEDVQKLKSEYAQMVRTAYRLKRLHTAWLFVLSSGSFNQAFRRWLFLKHYQQYRKKQLRLIQETLQTLEQKTGRVDSRRVDKYRLMQDLKSQRDEAVQEARDQQRLFEQLKKDEKRLRRNLEDQELRKKRLDLALENIIAREMKAAAARKDAAAKKSKEAPAPAKREKQAKASASAEIKVPESKDNESDRSGFGANRGKLTWPVQDGVVSRKFGKNVHDEFKITVNNNGIDILTAADNPVSCVYEGTVVGVEFVPGYQTSVIVSHDGYFSVYSRLHGVSVKPGAQLGAGTVLGKVFRDPASGQAELHFEIWKGRERLNPLNWLKL